MEPVLIGSIFFVFSLLTSIAKPGIFRKFA